MNVIQVKKYRRAAGLLLFVLLTGCVIFWQEREEKVQPTMAVETAAAETTAAAEHVFRPEEEDLYVDMRIERDRGRSALCELLTAAVQEEEDETAKREQQQELRAVMKNKQIETELETLLKARGYADALVFCSGGSISAIVRTDELAREEVAEIAAIIRRVSGITEEHITIRAKP